MFYWVINFNDALKYDLDLFVISDWLLDIIECGKKLWRNCSRPIQNNTCSLWNLWFVDIFICRHIVYLFNPNGSLSL